MIIIEGCDNTGKTKLIQYLGAELICRIIKSPGTGKPKVLAAWVLTMFQFQKIRPVIFDRFPIISEYVYGPILRGGDNLETYGRHVYWSLLKEMDPLIIYCRPPLDRILDLGDRSQMAGVKENITLLVDKYDYLMGLLPAEGFTVVKYDFTSEVLTKEVIKEMIKEYFLRRFK